MKRPFSILATREEIMLATEFVYPPIPVRDFDWCAVDDATYDYDSPLGEGRTELAAVNALLDRMEER